MSYRKTYGKYTYSGYQKKTTEPAKGQYRVKSPVRSFRDLEVYKQTILLSSRIYQLASCFEFDLKKDPHMIIMQPFHKYNARQAGGCSLDTYFLCTEWEHLKKTSREIPQWITESYGEKFTDAPSALAKLEEAVTAISRMTARFDFVLACLDETQQRDLRESIQSIIKNYQIQKFKILNLKKAWARVFK